MVLDNDLLYPMVCHIHVHETSPSRNGVTNKKERLAYKLVDEVIPNCTISNFSLELMDEYLKIRDLFMVVFNYYWCSMYADVYGPIRKSLFWVLHSILRKKSKGKREEDSLFFVCKQLRSVEATLAECSISAPENCVYNCLHMPYILT